MVTTTLYIYLFSVQDLRFHHPAALCRSRHDVKIPSMISIQQSSIPTSVLKLHIYIYLRTLLRLKKLFCSKLLDKLFSRTIPHPSTVISIYLFHISCLEREVNSQRIVAPINMDSELENIFPDITAPPSSYWLGIRTHDCAVCVTLNISTSYRQPRYFMILFDRITARTFGQLRTTFGGYRENLLTLSSRWM